MSKLKEANKRYKWLVEMLQKKHGISKVQSHSVLNGIADLTWDWNNSEYDIYGLELEETLTAIGAKRKPKYRGSIK